MRTFSFFAFYIDKRNGNTFAFNIGRSTLWSGYSRPNGERGGKLCWFSDCPFMGEGI